MMFFKTLDAKAEKEYTPYFCASWLQNEDKN